MYHLNVTDHFLGAQTFGHGAPQQQSVRGVGMQSNSGIRVGCSQAPSQCVDWAAIPIGMQAILVLLQSSAATEGVAFRSRPQRVILMM